jgi:uncharacterized membrane protein
MGFLGKVLTSPVLGPIQGVIWIAENLVEQAERELYDGEAVRGRLMELELRYDLGEISEEEYLAAEETLLERLRIIRQATEGREQRADR